MPPDPSAPNPPPAPAVAWTIAGSDSGGGAGIQADLKALHALGVHGCSVITALTAQNTQGVQRVEFTSAGMIEAQLLSLQHDLPPAAIKIGMLGTTTAIKSVAEFLKQRDTYVVLDPVMVATRGGTLLEPAAFGSLRDDLLPRVDLLTPNLPEAEAFVSYRIDSPAEVEKAAGELLRLGVKSVLIKGGHGAGALCQDYWTNGRESAWLSSPRWEVEHSHGGGCTLSSAIAAGVARGLPELDAIVLAKAYTNHGLRFARRIGQGRGPLAHGGWPDDPADLPWITAHAEQAQQRLAFPALEPGFGLYPIVDRADWVERLLALGVEMIQLRAKDLAGAALEDEVRRAVAAGRKANARVFINDAWQLALKFGAYGVHLGQDDLPTADLAALAAAGLRLGLSTHGYAEVARSLAVLPSYLAIGTVFDSPSKSFVHRPIGLEAFARLRKLVAQPVVAIGGITVERARDVRQAGADLIAVISDITKAPDLPARVAQWRAVL
jgi:hydroxymethylpyrimidine kinase/phosphomethylpyrimidine kinase/thiamine-phosphate diphosphorylase